MKFYYDFHNHTALSPCADDNNTPSQVVGLAKLNGLDVIAITDHNSCGNVRACIECGKSYDILVMAGIEVNTDEDIHIVCLFPSIEKAEAFQAVLDTFNLNIPNKLKGFGNQLLMNENDEVVGYEERLLTVATSLGIYNLVPLVNEYDGVAFPAHIDRVGNGILSILGEIDEDLGFTAVEFSRFAPQEIIEQYKKMGYKVLLDSDSHSLQDIGLRADFIELDELSEKNIINYLKNK